MEGREWIKGKFCRATVNIDSRYGIRLGDVSDPAVAAGLSGLFFSDFSSWWISIVSRPALSYVLHTPADPEGLFKIALNLKDLRCYQPCFMITILWFVKCQFFFVTLAQFWNDNNSQYITFTAHFPIKMCLIAFTHVKCLLFKWLGVFSVLFLLTKMGYTAFLINCINSQIVSVIYSNSKNFFISLTDLILS